MYALVAKMLNWHDKIMWYNLAQPLFLNKKLKCARIKQSFSTAALGILCRVYVFHDDSKID